MVKVIHDKSIYLLILAGLILPASNAFADGNTTDFSITVNPSVSLSVSSASVNFEITPTMAGAYNSANFTVTSATNNVYGYTLTMSTNNVNLTSNTVNPNTGTNPTIPTLTETQDGISAATFETSTDSSVLNHYGVAIGANNYNAMKASNQVKKTIANNTTADTTTINLASKLDLATVPGVYSTTLNFQIVANPLPGGLEEAYQNAGKSKKTINGKQYYAMQDMTSTICSNVTVEDDQIQVYDNRDDKIYWIAKLKDGHCWMTQNLDHDIVTIEGYYTHINTDLGWGSDAATISWTPERSTIPVTDILPSGSISGWINSSTDPYSVDTGDWYWTGTWYSSSANNYLNGNAGDKFSQTPYINNGAHGYIGNYYNWTAAIASNDSSSFTSDTKTDISGNPQNSICPAGWRLPTISADSSGSSGTTNEFLRFNTVYGNFSDRVVIANPLWFVRGGFIDSGNLKYSGYDGSYWSSTVGSTNLAYRDLFDSSGNSPDASSPRGIGWSVRCIAR